MKNAEQIKLLIEAIRHYQVDFNSSAYSTMGFSVIAAGWLITSAAARAFLHAHRWLAYVAIVLIIAASIGYSWMALRVQALSLAIYVQLRGFPEAQGLFEHYLLTSRGVFGYIALQGFASLFIVLVLVATLRNPVCDTKD